MLSKKEKEEILNDAKSIKRREVFSKAREISLENSRSLDEFINFLEGIQKVFSPISISQKKSITRLNKL